MLKEQELKPKTWTDARKLLAQRESDLGQLQKRKATLTEAGRAAERLGRIGPAAQHRQTLLVALEAEAATIVMAFAAEVAIAAATSAERDRAAAERLHQQTIARGEALAADPNILTNANAIEALVSRSGEIAKGKRRGQARRGTSAETRAVESDPCRAR